MTFKSTLLGKHHPVPTVAQGGFQQARSKPRNCSVDGVLLTLSLTITCIVLSLLRSSCSYINLGTAHSSSAGLYSQVDVLVPRRNSALCDRLGTALRRKLSRARQLIGS